MIEDKFYKLPTDPMKPLMIKGNSFLEIKMFRNNSIDTIIQDLPYLISFMNLSWDNLNENTKTNYTNFFKECFRVLKPGGYMAIFTGVKSYDLFVNWCREAEFGVKNMFTWIYKSGMPHGVDFIKFMIKQDHLDNNYSISIDVLFPRLKIQSLHQRI